VKFNLAQVFAGLAKKQAKQFLFAGFVSVRNML
jgi:hypothetical protein